MMGVYIACSWCTCNCTNTYVVRASQTTSAWGGVYRESVVYSSTASDWNRIFKPAKNWRWFDKFREVAAIVQPAVIAIHEAARRWLQPRCEAERRRHKRKRFIQALVAQ